jgi:hypothetical protein
MTKSQDPPLRASDVLNWDHLVRIAAKPEGRTDTSEKAIAGFAYDFTSTADESVRDQILSDLIQNGTYKQSRETAEEVIKALAGRLQSDRRELRKFAKQIGIRLCFDWVLARRDPTF